MKDILKLIYFFLIFAVANNLYAQKIDGGTLEKLSALRMPAEYKTPTGKILGEKAERIKSGDPVWFVFSDKENNKTYSDKNCTQEMGTVAFLETFVVAQETDEAVRLVAYDGADVPWEIKGGKANFKKSAYDKGWIRKKNLLLWQNCLIDEDTKYSKKAISVKKLPESGDYTELLKMGVLDIYNSSKKAKENLLDKDIRLFQYLFVFKEDKENNMYLLSKAISTYPGSVSNDVIGWVSINQLHLWNNAMCLRTNLSPEAIQERKDKKIDVKFFKTFDEAKKFRDAGAGDNLMFLYSDIADENIKDNPYYYGFPIIDSTKDRNIYKTGYITDTKSKNNKTVFRSREQATYNQNYENSARQKQKINIVFVLDGNSRDYIKSVARAIMDNPTIGSERTRSDFRLGSIIYNDPTCGEEASKKIAFTSNKESFVDMLNKEGLKQPCPMNKNGTPMYEALKQACAMFNDERTTNIIILAGSATDKDKSKRADVLQSLISKQVMMHIYQITNLDGVIFDDFLRDGKYFLEKASGAIDDQQFKSLIDKKTVQKSKLELNGNDFLLVNSAIPGAMYSKDKGQSFTVADINKRLKKLFTDVNEKLLSVINRYDENTVGTRTSSNIDDEEKKRLILMFKSMDVPDDICEKLANENNFQLFIQAFAPLGSTKLKNQLLIRTLFLSSKEFDRLVDSFDKLKDGAAQDQRTGMINAYKDIITAYKGGNVDAKKLDNFSPNEFMKLVTSLPPNNNPLFKKSLNDLNNPKKTSDDDIDKLKKVFITMGNGLKKLKKLPIYKMEQDDETFYWVPEVTFQIPPDLFDIK
jgi:hypothetical protein